MGDNETQTQRKPQGEAPARPLWDRVGVQADFLWLARTLPSCVVCPVDPGRQVVADLATHAAAVVAQAPQGPWPCDRLNDLLRELVVRFGLERVAFVANLTASCLPCVVVLPGQGIGIVRERRDDGTYVLETVAGVLRVSGFAAGTQFLTFEVAACHKDTAKASARAVLTGIFFVRKGWIVQLFIASTLASFLLLGTSFYSMQVYDRVVANGGFPTLIVLTIGVLFALLVEFVLKLVRMSITHAALDRIEIEMATRVFQVMLGIRLDRFPTLLGAFSAQLRGFEAIKVYLAARTTFFVCELPFCVFFLVMIYALGGPVIATVPAVSLCLALASGLVFKTRIHAHARQEQGLSRSRQGHLIETLKNIELIKAHAAEWRMQGTWNQLTGQTVREGSQARSASEIAAALGSSLQQVSYVCLVAVGAWLATTQAEMTTGSIVACSILSGRIFAPIARLPSLLVQWGYAEEARTTLDKIFARQSESQTHRPLLVSAFAGACELRDITFAYKAKSPKVCVDHLKICSGEKVAVLGRVGSGKSTLLKMLAGLLCPESGQVLIDGLDVFSIAAERRADLIGYLPQTPGLIQGTVRENLLMGKTGISDDALIAACQATGLAEVLAQREQGLETPIHEGGQQFSGGETQLVALTRLLLVAPRLWLLDEPTASCDSPGEQQILSALRSRIGVNDTLVLVSHNIPPLDLVDRVVVFDGNTIIADGPKAQVLGA